MENLACSDPHLHKDYFWKIYSKFIYKKDISRKPMFENNAQQELVGILSKIAKQIKLSDDQIWTNNMFKDDSIFSCIVWAILVIIKKSAGQYFAKILKVPKNHPKSFGIWSGTLISHFGII